MLIKTYHFNGRFWHVRKNVHKYVFECVRRCSDVYYFCDLSGYVPVGKNRNHDFSDRIMDINSSFNCAGPCNSTILQFPNDLQMGLLCSALSASSGKNRNHDFSDRIMDINSSFNCAGPCNSTILQFPNDLQMGLLCSALSASSGKNRNHDFSDRIMDINSRLKLRRPLQRKNSSIPE